MLMCDVTARAKIIRMMLNSGVSIIPVTTQIGIITTPIMNVNIPTSMSTMSEFID